MTRKTNRVNVDWETCADGHFTWEQVIVEVLQDIRSELRQINRKLSPLECPNFVAIPRTLRRISANTAKPRVAKKKPKLRIVA